MNRILPIAFFTLLSLASGCGERNGSGELPVIDVAGSLGTYRQVPMSEPISELEYVPLETGADFMIGGNNQYIVTESHIFVRSGSYCYAFNRQGKFLTNIGHAGRGPGEYTYCTGMSVDENGRVIYLETTDNILGYTWDGKFLRSFDKPKLKEEEPYGAYDRPQVVSFLRDNLFFGHVMNNSGHEPYSWVMLDDTGSIVKKFPQSVKIEKEDRFITSYLGAPRSFVTLGEAYAKEYLNDTVFLLNRRDELVPKFVFNLGKYAFPHDVFLSFDGGNNPSDNSIILNNNVKTIMSVASRDIFFSATVGNNLLSVLGAPQGLSYTIYIQGNEIVQDDTNIVLGLYDIRRGKTELLDRDPVSRKYGLVNDIDGGLSFWPKYHNSPADELVDVWEAYEMKELLTEEYFAAHPAKDPAAHARLRTLLKNLSEESNPVVVVAKLKK